MLDHSTHEFKCNIINELIIICKLWAFPSKRLKRDQPYRWLRACDATDFENTSSPAMSILNSLRSLQPSDLAGPRIIKHHKPPAGKKRHQPSLKTSHNPKSVSPRQRVSEFSNENLTVSSGKLFCSGCREELGLMATVVKMHSVELWSLRIRQAIGG